MSDTPGWLQELCDSGKDLALTHDQLVELVAAVEASRAERDQLRIANAELLEALRRVIAHTAYAPTCNTELLEGLLASVERIARAAIAKAEGKP